MSVALLNAVVREVFVGDFCLCAGEIRFIWSILPFDEKLVIEPVFLLFMTGKSSARLGDLAKKESK